MSPPGAGARIRALGSPDFRRAAFAASAIAADNARLAKPGRRLLAMARTSTSVATPASFSVATSLSGVAPS